MGLKHHLCGLTITIVVLVTLTTAPAIAQEDEPIGSYVVDLRGSRPFYGQSPVIASSHGIVTSTLPSRGQGLAIGAHWYPLKWRQIALGLGGEYMSTFGSTVSARVSDGLSDKVRIKFVSLAPQLSFNFGHRNGWSFLSGGISSTRFTVLGEKIQTADIEPRPKTINYGGGARWFTNNHIAFTFDLRFYAMSPVKGNLKTPPTPRMTVVVLNIGVSFR